MTSLFKENAWPQFHRVRLQTRCSWTAPALKVELIRGCNQERLRHAGWTGVEKAEDEEHLDNVDETARLYTHAA